MTDEHAEPVPGAIKFEAMDDSIASATRRLGLMLVAQSELLSTVSLASPTGMTASVTQELCGHMRQLGQYLTAGAARAVILDRESALAAALLMNLASARTLQRLGVRFEDALMEEELFRECEAMCDAVDAGPDGQGGNPSQAVEQRLAQFLDSIEKKLPRFIDDSPAPQHT